MRAVFIVTGATLLAMFHWTIYVFGAALVLLGLKMLLQRDTEVHPERNPLFGYSIVWFPRRTDTTVHASWSGENGRWLATPLLLVLIAVEATDIVFAVDSIPRFLPSRATVHRLYVEHFCHSGTASIVLPAGRTISNLHYLKTGLALVLCFVGSKMLVADVLKIPSPRH